MVAIPENVAGQPENHERVNMTTRDGQAVSGEQQVLDSVGARTSSWEEHLPWSAPGSWPRQRSCLSRFMLLYLEHGKAAMGLSIENI
jgi:hypothetical protein